MRAEVEGQTERATAWRSVHGCAKRKRGVGRRQTLCGVARGCDLSNEVAILCARVRSAFRDGIWRIEGQRGNEETET